MAKQSTTAGTRAAYNAFLKNVELYALGLESVSAELKRQEYADAYSQDKGKVTHKLESSFSVSDFEEDHFDVLAKFVFTMSFQDDEPILFMTASFSAHFHPKDGQFVLSHAEKFAHGEARLLFWPYFREALSDVTGRMYVRPVTIPFALES